MDIRYSPFADCRVTWIAQQVFSPCGREVSASPAAQARLQPFRLPPGDRKKAVSDGIEKEPKPSLRLWPFSVLLYFFSLRRIRKRQAPEHPENRVGEVSSKAGAFD